jgi:histidinol-phosphatase (PHP family)
MTSYHTHSRWSDGQATIAAMVAADAGLDEVGISDHYVLTPYPGETTAAEWSMPLDDLGAYVDDVASAMATAPLPVRLGLELDYFPETWGALAERLAPYDFDYLIGSVHYVDRFNIDGSADDWRPLDQERINAMHVAYWQRVAGLAATGIFDFVGHPDLVKKFAFYASDGAAAGALAALDAISAAGMAIELNTSGWDKPCAEAYPSRSLLMEARARQIPVVLTADAHVPGELARHFQRGRELLKAVGYDETVRFSKRERLVVPL